MHTFYLFFKYNYFLKRSDHSLGEWACKIILRGGGEELRPLPSHNLRHWIVDPLKVVSLQRVWNLFCISSESPLQSPLQCPLESPLQRVWNLLCNLLHLQVVRFDAQLRVPVALIVDGVQASTCMQNILYVILLAKYYMENILLGKLITWQVFYMQ